ncbi:hypothetical protein ABZT02_07570 [Streptomyces sp. NPDC005402]|uniref:hypothetical protein n=1 Tax=Streptomyces sp. NPDC005402 TaxID=3155338 RepID=UPI0033A9A8B4
MKRTTLSRQIASSAAIDAATLDDPHPLSTDTAREHNDDSARAEFLGQGEERGQQLADGTYDDTTRCVYDGSPAVAARTGQSGNRYGVCGPCSKSSAHLTAICFRIELAKQIKAGLDAYNREAGENDRRSPRVRNIDIYDAAQLALEDVMVTETQQALREDGHAEGINEAVNRYGARMGRLLGGGLDELFTACVAAARAEGRNPKQAVAELSGMLSTYAGRAASDALKGRR